jgi:predicted PurR-regulated permease PerM
VSIAWIAAIVGSLLLFLLGLVCRENFKGLFQHLGWNDLLINYWRKWQPQIHDLLIKYWQQWQRQIHWENLREFWLLWLCFLALS